MKPVKLSNNFYLDELTRTSYRQFQEENNNPPESVVKQLKLLAYGVLQPIRDHFNCIVYMTSGYRCWGLNRLLGSGDSSQHRKGGAGDFVVQGYDTLEKSMEVFDWIYKHSDIRFGQIIHEVRDRGGYHTIWIHISLGYPSMPMEKSGQVMLFRDGKYIMVRYNYDSPILQS